MKKIYFAPDTNIVKLQSNPLLNVVSDGYGNVDHVTSGGDYEGDAEGVLSRRGSLWDDEEDD